MELVSRPEQRLVKVIPFSRRALRNPRQVGLRDADARGDSCVLRPEVLRAAEPRGAEDDELAVPRRKRGFLETYAMNGMTFVSSSGCRASVLKSFDGRVPSPKRLKRGLHVARPLRFRQRLDARRGGGRILREAQRRTPSAASESSSVARVSPKSDYFDGAKAWFV